MDSCFHYTSVFKRMYINALRKIPVEHEGLVGYLVLAFLSCGEDWCRDDAQSREQYLHMLRDSGVHARIPSVSV